MITIKLRLLLALFLIGTAIVSCVPSTSAPQNNIDIAHTFIKARADYNPALLEGLFADNSQNLDVATSLDQYPDLFTYYKAINWTFKVGDCQEASTTLVNCSTEFTNDLAMALNNGPYEMTFGITIVDSKITAVRPRWNREFIDNNLVPFWDFLKENHASDFSAIRGPTDHFFPRGDAAIALLKTYSAEFVAAQ